HAPPRTDPAKPAPAPIETPKPAPTVEAVPIVVENATWKMPEKPAEKSAPVATARINAQASQTPPASAPEKKAKKLEVQPAGSTTAPATNENVFTDQPVVGSTAQPSGT